jgi:predicted lactoylglutathione lyase
MWISSPGSFTTATPESRMLWTSAARGVVRATAAHEVRTLQTHTPNHVGCLLTKATSKQFEKLGANIDIGSVNDVSGDFRMFESLDQINLNGSTCTDMMYDLTINDSDATVYTARVYLDEAMLSSCVNGRGVPMVFYALQQLDSINDSVPDVAEVLRRAFGSAPEVTHTDTGVEPQVHCVASTGSTSRRMFPIGLNSELSPRSVLGTQTDKTILFNTDREITHHVTTYSVRAIDMSSGNNRGSDRYLVAQNVKIEHVGGTYSANVTMSIVGTDARGVIPRNVSVTHTVHPYTSIENDLGLSSRNSVLHVFTNGNHYSMLLAHLHNSNYARSLQLTAYASLRALNMAGKESKSDIDRIMKTATMETLFDSSSLPVILARKSSTPFVCVVVPGTVDTCPTTPRSLTIDKFERNAFRVREDEKSYLVNMENENTLQNSVKRQVPVQTLDIESLPGPVQNALRRQWGC